MWLKPRQISIFVLLPRYANDGRRKHFAFLMELHVSRNVLNSANFAFMRFAFLSSSPLRCHIKEAQIECIAIESAGGKEILWSKRNFDVGWDENEIEFFSISTCCWGSSSGDVEKRGNMWKPSSPSCVGSCGEPQKRDWVESDMITEMESCWSLSISPAQDFSDAKAKARLRFMFFVHRNYRFCWICGDLCFSATNLSRQMNNLISSSTTLAGSRAANGELVAGIIALPYDSFWHLWGELEAKSYANCSFESETEREVNASLMGSR